MIPIRCADCGFLGLRNQTTGALDEADKRFREEVFFRGAPQIHDSVPICAKSVINFRDEANPGDKDGIRKALNKDRSCSCHDKFTQWHVGFTPKEHQEMEIATKLKAWEESQQEERRRWQESQDRARRDHEDSRDKSNREWQGAQNWTNRKWQAVFTVMAALFGLLGVILGKYLK